MSNEAAIELLKRWRADESGYDEEVWPIIKSILDENRLSVRGGNMIDQQLTDADIETRLSWLLTLPPFDPILIRPMIEIRELRELKATRAQRSKMKITGYRTPTEKECDYLTIRNLLQKYGMLGYGVPALNINQVLDKLREDLCLPVGSVLSSDIQLLQFRLVYNDSPSHTIVLDQLPENTTELLIETK